MWCAKNSITGKVYGGNFESVYDCQAFIDEKLFLLEYEFSRCFSLEKNLCDNLENRSLVYIINDCLREFTVSSDIEKTMSVIVDFTMKGKKQIELDAELHRLACSRFQCNNIIRCYNVEQCRFADGFDF